MAEKIADGKPVSFLDVLRLFIAQATVVALMLVLIALLYYQYQYIGYPRHPDPATFRVSPIKIKSDVVYVTVRQALIQSRWIFAEKLLFVLVVLNIVTIAIWPLPFLSRAALYREKYGLPKRRPWDF